MYFDTGEVDFIVGGSSNNKPTILGKRKMPTMHLFINRALPYLLILPGIIFVGSILIYPMISGVFSSFFIQHPLNPSDREFVGFGHFEKMFSDEIFIQAFKNTILWTVGIVVGQYIVGLGVALLLNESFPGRGIYRSLILIPWVIPMIAAALTWKWIYATDFGVLNYILKKMGFISGNIDWLGDPSLSLLSVMAVTIWKNIPFVAVVLLAGLQSIDKQMYEAASISGANMLQRFWYITLPNLKKVSLVILILTTIWTFNQFDLIYLMTKGGPANSSQIVPVYSYLNAFNYLNINYAAAIATFGAVIMSIFVVLYIRNTREES